MVAPKRRLLSPSLITPVMVCATEIFVKRKNKAQIVIYFKFKVLNLNS